MRALAAISAIALAVALGACGDDETTSIPAGPTGATGPREVESENLTAEEFVAASIPDQLAAVVDAVEANPDCEDANTDPGGDLQVSVAIDASTADPDTPLSDIVADNC